MLDQLEDEVLDEIIVDDQIDKELQIFIEQKVPQQTKKVTVLDDIQDFESIQTKNYVIEANQALNGDEGQDVRQMVLNYQQVRNSCLSFRNVYKLLGKEQLLADNSKLLDINQIPQIGKDLEERNKQTAIKSLKEQGMSYKNFNNEIVKVIDHHNEEGNEEALEFRQKLKKIENSLYFDKKYNLDYIINHQYGNYAHQMLEKEFERMKDHKRKRDKKINEKSAHSQLLKKYI